MKYLITNGISQKSLLMVDGHLGEKVWLNAVLTENWLKRVFMEFIKVVRVEMVALYEMF